MIGRKAKHHERASWRKQVWIQLKHYLQCVESIANQDAIDSTSMSTKPQISIYTPLNSWDLLFLCCYMAMFFPMSGWNHESFHIKLLGSRWRPPWLPYGVYPTLREGRWKGWSPPRWSDVRQALRPQQGPYFAGEIHGKSETKMDNWGVIP